MSEKLQQQHGFMMELISTTVHCYATILNRRMVGYILNIQYSPHVSFLPPALG